MMFFFKFKSGTLLEIFVDMPGKTSSEILN